jgi:hypothetical protein
MKKLLQYAIFALALSNGLFAQEKEKIDVDFTGYGAAGFRFVDRNQLVDYNQETYFEGKFQVELKYNKNIEAQLDFRGNSSDNAVDLREYSIKFEYWDKMKFEVGNLKKVFGLEYLSSEENLIQIRRSFIQRSFSDQGYGNRALTLMGYYKYSKKRPEYPYSYYFSVYKDNSLNAGAATRFSYHTSSMAYSAGYLFQNRGGEAKFSSHGVEADVQFEQGDFTSNAEAYFGTNTEEGIRRKMAGLNSSASMAGFKTQAALNFNINKEVIKDIEPFVLAGFLVPDTDESEVYTIETLLGANFYFHKDVRFRLNGDLLLTKNKYSDELSTIGSSVTLEFQAKF